MHRGTARSSGRARERTQETISPRPRIMLIWFRPDMTGLRDARCNVPKKCAQCGAILRQYNPGKVCWPCQEKGVAQVPASSENLDAEALAGILCLKSPESVKRLARKGRLPPRIPGVRKCLWPRPVIEAWIKSAGRLDPSLAEAMTLAQGLGWDIQTLTDHGSNPQKLIKLAARYRSGDRRGML